MSDRKHWRETATDRPGRWLPIFGVLAEDENGDLCVPCVRRHNWWGPKLDFRKPWHWPSYLNSRITRRLTMVSFDVG